MTLLGKTSWTGVGMLVYVITSALAYYGVAVDTTTIEGAANALFQLVGFALMVIGQLRRKDLKMGLYRK